MDFALLSTIYKRTISSSRVLFKWQDDDVPGPATLTTLHHWFVNVSLLLVVFGGSMTKMQKIKTRLSISALARMRFGQNSKKDLDSYLFRYKLYKFRVFSLDPVIKIVIEEW